MEGKKRIVWIDGIKILALFIVLCNHAGLSLGWGTYLGGMFYVAVFFVLAGYTYRRNSDASLPTVVKKRAKRLLIPYFGFNGFLYVFFAVKALASGEAFAWKRELLGILYSRSYLSPEGGESLMGILNGPTWFLTGLFTALIGYEIAVRLAGEGTRRLAGILAGCVVIALGLSYLPILLPWSLDTMFFHMALIGLGQFLADGQRLMRLYQDKRMPVLLIIVFGAAALGAGTGNLSVRDYGEQPVLYMLATASGCMLVMMLGIWAERHIFPVAWAAAALGRHTVSILCLHLFVFMFVEGGMALFGFPAGSLAVKLTKVCAGYLPGACVLLWDTGRGRRKGEKETRKEGMAVEGDK